MKKRIFCLILAMIMLFSVAACSKDPLQNASETETAEEQNDTGKKPSGGLMFDDDDDDDDDDSGSGSGLFFDDDNESGSFFGDDEKTSKPKQKVDPKKLLADATKPYVGRVAEVNTGVKGQFCVGMARNKFTPTSPYGMGGYDNPDFRKTGKVLDDVCSTCVAYQDETGEIALMFTLDLISVNETCCNRARNVIRKIYPSIKAENIFFSATHTHSAPTINYSDKSDTGHWLGKSSSVDSWAKSTTQTVDKLGQISVFYKAILDSTTGALSNLSPATVSIGRIEIPHMNFIRRYVDANGNFLGTNSINYPDGTKCADPRHETEVDDTMQVIKFYRGLAEPIALINWQAHPTYNSGSTVTDVSASYIHYVRKAVESAGYLCAYFQGACGNIITSSLVPSDKQYVLSSSQAYGEKLAKEAVKVLKDGTRELQHIGTIKSSWLDCVCTVDHTQDAKAAQGLEVYQLFKANKVDEASDLAKKYGFADAYDARDVYTKSQMEKTGKVKVATLRIGGLGFAFPSYEQFDTNGMQIKDGSNCEMTFICELSNAGNSYIPSYLGAISGGYEARSCKYIAGTGEQLANEMIKMLNESNS